VLRDAGVGYGDYLEQLTYMIFLKIAMSIHVRRITAMWGFLMNTTDLAENQARVKSADMHKNVLYVPFRGWSMA